MPETLLRTKLFVPPVRPNLVPRPHLIKRLNQGLQLGHKLTLVSAPAGFGKTTLVTEWLHKSPIPNSQFAWFSLDENDNDLTRFLTYFVAAMQTIETTVGETAVAFLQSPQPVPPEVILTSLLNDIAGLAGEHKSGAAAHPDSGRLPSHRRPRHSQRLDLPIGKYASQLSSGSD